MAVASIVCLVGCKKDIDKEHMDAAADWATKLCKCKESDEPKKCADKLHAKKPQDGSGSKPPAEVFTRESFEAFEALIQKGDRCWGEAVEK
jgi:hypothetical protein